MENCIQRTGHLVRRLLSFILNHTLDNPSVVVDIQQKHKTSLFLQTYPFPFCYPLYKLNNQTPLCDHNLVGDQVISRMVFCFGLFLTESYLLCK